MEFSVLHTVTTFVLVISCLSIYIYMMYIIYDLKFTYKQIILYLLSSGLTIGISSVLLNYLGYENIKAIVLIPFLVILTYIILRCNWVRSIILTSLYTIILAFAVAVTNLIFSFFGIKIDVSPNSNYTNVQ